MTGSIERIDHPLVRHKVSWLRQRDLNSRDYADLLRELGLLLAVEATRNMPLFPNGDDMGPAEAPEKPIWPVLVALIRSGLTMAEGASSIVPSRHMGHLGLVHDYEAKEVFEFMCTMPVSILDRHVIVIDSFAVSGQSIVKAIEILHDRYKVPLERITVTCCSLSRTACQTFSGHNMASQVRVLAAHIDGDTDDSQWSKYYVDMNYRLFGTRSKRLPEKF